MGKSLWENGVKTPDFPSLNEDKKTDVLIIGGGIAGILTAYLLHKQNIDYILVEKNKICSGTTKNTTGKITYQQGLLYHKIYQNYGLEFASKVLAANKNACEKLSEIAHKLDCDFEIKDNYVYSTNNPKAIEEELKILNEINGLSSYCKSVEIPIKTVGAIKTINQGQFNPLKFINQISKNLNIFENTFIEEIYQNVAFTENHKITAKKILVATHFPFINKHGNYFLKLYQHRSYIMALENDKPLGGMYVDENEKGFSFRNYKNYLLLGGGGHRTGVNNSNLNKLRTFAKENYPHSKEKFFWGAQDCMSLDNIPYIGNYSKNTPDLYVATGFNKWGMCSSMLSALILSDLLTEKRNEFSDIFTTSRNIFKPQLFINSFETAKNFFSFSKKRCPHLGCALKWNKYEHSWDCPCHGSRFDNDGKILDNPANKINK